MSSRLEELDRLIRELRETALQDRQETRGRRWFWYLACLLLVAMIVRTVTLIASDYQDQGDPCLPLMLPSHESDDLLWLSVSATSERYLTIQPKTAASTCATRGYYPATGSGERAPFPAIDEN